MQRDWSVMAIVGGIGAVILVAWLASLVFSASFLLLAICFLVFYVVCLIIPFLIITEEEDGKRVEEARIRKEEEERRRVKEQRRTVEEERFITPSVSMEKSPWGWRTLWAVSLFGSLAAGGIIAGINWRRIGRHGLMWPTIIVPIIVMICLLFLPWPEIDDPSTMSYTGIGISFAGAGVLWLLQRGKWRSWKESHPQAQRAGWEIPVVTVIVVSVIVVGLAFIPALTTGPAIAKPTVGYVPQGWYLSEDSAYGTYEMLDGTVWGLIKYTDAEDYDVVGIFYGDVHPSLKGWETDPSALTTKAIEYASFDPEETGTMTVTGQTAGYAKVYHSVQDVYSLVIVFVKDSICINIGTEYDATSEDEAEVMSIIDSISF